MKIEKHCLEKFYLCIGLFKKELRIEKKKKYRGLKYNLPSPLLKVLKFDVGSKNILHAFKKFSNYVEFT